MPVWSLGLTTKRARAHRVFQVPPELGVGLGDFLDATADSPRHSGPSPLGGAPQRAHRPPSPSAPESSSI